MPTPIDIEQMIQYLSELGLEQKVAEMTDADIADVRAIKKNLKISQKSEATFLIVLAVNKAKSNNQLTKIRCRGGTAIGGYTYDNVNDCYTLRCVGYLSLGYIPVSFNLTSKTSHWWSVPVPIPEAIILKHLDEIQRLNLDKFKNSYSSEHYFEYLQLIN